MPVASTYTDPRNNPPDKTTGQTYDQTALEDLLSNIYCMGGADGHGGLFGGVVPPGSVVAYGAGTTDPTGWFLCDGRAVSRTTYANLFSAIGTTYGIGDNSTTFNIPDLRGRAIFAADNMGTAAGAASRFTANNTLAATAQGEFTHALVTAELAVHTHTLGSHTHATAIGGSFLNDGGSYKPSSTGDGAATVQVGGSTTAGATPTIANTGSGTAHNTIPLSQIVNYIVKS